MKKIERNEIGLKFGTISKKTDVISNKGFQEAPSFTLSALCFYFLFFLHKFIVQLLIARIGCNMVELNITLTGL